MNVLERWKQFVTRFEIALTMKGTGAIWQTAHFMLGMLAPAVLYVVWPHWYMLVIGAVLIGFAYGYPKEFWYDIKYEKANEREGWNDLYAIWSGSGLLLALYGVSRLVYLLRGIQP